MSNILVKGKKLSNMVKWECIPEDAHDLFFFSAFWFCHRLSLGDSVTDVVVLLVTWNIWSEVVNEKTCQEHFGQLSHG